uniref:Uncharacterized protein n=1 Tax=Rhizophora mucronata TaxID=61149 RepID=A0A2P2NF71_RHIMU
MLSNFPLSRSTKISKFQTKSLNSKLNINSFL